VKTGKSASETLALLTLAYGQYAVKKSTVFEWHKLIKKGQDVQDDPRSGQSKTQRTYADVDRLQTLVRSDRRSGARLIAEEMNMNRETVQQIIMEDLGIRKMSAKKVSQILKDDHKQHRLLISSDLLHNREIFDKVIIGDETWCFQHNPETKGHRMQWKIQNSSWPKKARVLLSRPCVCVSSVTKG
jgi:hypothetical protein